MRIVYDQPETLVAGLGQPDRTSDHASLVSDLWAQLNSGPPQPAMAFQLQDSSPGFWDDLYLIGDSSDSQYDLLRQFNFTDPDSSRRIACLALTGKGFHGQLQRPWCVSTGNLHLSVTVPLDLPAGKEALAWTMLPAVAVMRALRILGVDQGSDCGIKWVNDILWHSRKMAGVISSLVVEGGRIQRGFLGIGLNVTEAPLVSPAPEQLQATALHDHMPAERAPLGKVGQLILKTLGTLIKDFESGKTTKLGDEYRSNSLVIGRQVRVRKDSPDGLGQPIAEGKVLAISPDLGLIIEGEKDPILNGRLYFL